MKIFFFGPSGSGKSTIILWLNEQLNYQVLSIDKYRELHCDYTWSGMDTCNQIFLSEIRNDDTDQIIECSGIGKLGELIRYKISNIRDQIHIIMVMARPNVCMSRNITKAWYAIKLPYKPVNSINKMLKDQSQYSDLLSTYSKYSPIHLTNNNQYDLNQIKRQLASIFSQFI